MRFRFPIRYRELLDQWKYQLLETVSRLVCKGVSQFGDRIGMISCQEGRHVNFDDSSAYRTTDPRSIRGHGLNIHHNLLPNKDFLKGINHPLLHRRGGPYKIWGPSRNSLATPNKKTYTKFSHWVNFVRLHCKKRKFKVLILSQGTNLRHIWAP